MRFRPIRSYGKRLYEFLRGGLRITLILQRKSEIIVRVGIVWIESQSFPVEDRSLLPLFFRGKKERLLPILSRCRIRCQQSRYQYDQRE